MADKDQTPCNPETHVDISCEEVMRALGGYLEDDLDPDLQLRMREHFKKCSHCRAILDGSKNVIQLVGDGHAFDVPAGFGSRLFGKLERHLTAKKKS